MTTTGAQTCSLGIADLEANESQPNALATHHADTETIEVYYRDLLRARRRVVAELKPDLLVAGLVKRTLVEELGLYAHLRPIRTDLEFVDIEDPGFETIGSVDLRLLTVRNDQKIWRATFVVVEHWTSDIVLGRDLCCKAAIKRGLELGPFPAKKSKKERQAEEEAERKAKEANAALKAQQIREMMERNESAPKQEPTNTSNSG